MRNMEHEEHVLLEETEIIVWFWFSGEKRRGTRLEGTSCSSTTQRTKVSGSLQHVKPKLTGGALEVANAHVHRGDAAAQRPGS